MGIDNKIYGIFWRSIVSIGHTLVIILYLLLMILEVRLPFANYSPTTVDLLMGIGALLWVIFVFDPLVTQTKHWAAPIYLSVIILTLISVVAVFLDDTNPLTQLARWLNAGISVVLFFICSYRIHKSQMEYL
ncbi:MAG: hypothetical protein AAB552_02390 [Patescibacteria group bacterium]